MERWTDGHDETNGRILRLKIKHCIWGRNQQGMWAIELDGVSRARDVSHTVGRREQTDRLTLKVVNVLFIIRRPFGRGAKFWAVYIRLTDTDNWKLHPQMRVCVNCQMLATSHQALITNVHILLPWMGDEFWLKEFDSHWVKIFAADWLYRGLWRFSVGSFTVHSSFSD